MKSSEHKEAKSDLKYENERENDELDGRTLTQKSDLDEKRLQDQF
jgi:hypothetical protein